MTTKRLGLLAIILAVGMSAIFTLPRSTAQPTGLRLQEGRPFLPGRVSTWEGKDQEITKAEIETLGPGTEFARKLYLHPRGGTYAFTTIVLSGRDIAGSLHRPERCLGAQGWSSLGSETIGIALPKLGSFPVQRLHNFQMKRGNDGKTREIEAYTYYWFVGEHTLSASHYGRLFTDSKDRMMRGLDQRWAYISVTAVIPPQNNPEQQDEARKWVDREIRDFIQDLAPTIHSEAVSYD